jgi:hypothetical protein
MVLRRLGSIFRCFLLFSKRREWLVRDLGKPISSISCLSASCPDRASVGGALMNWSHVLLHFLTSDGFRLHKHFRGWMMSFGVSDHPCEKCIHTSSESWSSHRAKLRMAPFQDAPATPFADSRRESFFSILFSFSRCASFVESARPFLFACTHRSHTLAQCCSVLNSRSLPVPLPPDHVLFVGSSSMCFVLAFSMRFSLCSPAESTAPRFFVCVSSDARRDIRAHASGNRAAARAVFRNFCEAYWSYSVR